jgi:hypothetical protein
MAGIKKILHLTLKKKWFDLIASGEKKIEYREDKPYWQKRLLDGEEYKPFDEIHFRNGYSKDAPFMRVEFKSISFTGPKWCKPDHGEILTGDTLAIHLGPVLEIK